MTPLPKRRPSRAKQGKRRARILLSLHGLVVCKNCGAKIRSHIVCFNCGYYNNRMVKTVKVAKTKK